MKNTDKIFLFSALSIILVIIFGTAIAFVSGKANPGNNLRKQDPTPESIAQSSVSGTSVYSQIGTLRCSTADNPSIPMVVTPYFPYPSDDSAFYEELFKKNQKLRQIIQGYFELYTREELLSIGESTIKESLIIEINKELVLGKITEIFFTEYIFLV